MERFMSHAEVDPDTDCWMWTGALRDGRYGAFSPEGRRGSLAMAHRWIYEQMVGPIPEGQQLDHFVCARTSCVNPDHVRPTSARENTVRSTGPAAINLAKTHCKNGHEFTPENTRILSDGERRCRTCVRERMRAYRAENPWSEADRLAQRARRARRSAKS
jgi:hypothetical protein